MWMPLSLDLRDNPRLHLIGSGALDSIAGKLEEMLLPKSMRYISLETLRVLLALSAVYFEGNDEITIGNGLINNIIVGELDKFGDVCCNRGPRIDLSSPATGLTFCDMQTDQPGIDAAYEPFELLHRSVGFTQTRAEVTFHARGYGKRRKVCRGLSRS